MNWIDTTSGCAAELDTAQLCIDDNSKQYQLLENVVKSGKQLQEENQDPADLVSKDNKEAMAMLAELQANGMPEGTHSNEVIEKYIFKLEAGNADAMCRLASCCMNGCISDEMVRQIADNRIFKMHLYELARNYALGFTEPDSDREAFLVFQQTKDYNDPDIHCALGRAYQYGWGVERNVESAIEHYTKAADAGSFEALQRLESCEDDDTSKHLEAAFKHFRQLADSGNVDAQFAVACCYYFGIGVVKNYTFVKTLLNQMIGRSCINATTLLGILYENGHGVKRNIEIAVDLYKQAANLGNSEARFRLAQHHFSGKNVTANAAQIMFWVEKAAEQGHAGAACLLGDYHAEKRGCEGHDAEAFRYYRQSAIAGDKTAQQNVGEACQIGEHTPHSHRRAVYWYQKSLQQGNEDLAGFYNECCRKMHRTTVLVKDAFPPDFGLQTAQLSVSGLERLKNFAFKLETAFLLAKLAAIRKCQQAFRIVGDCFYHGFGVSKNDYAAAINYERANPVDLATLRRLANCYVVKETYTNELDEFAVFQRLNAALRADINLALLQMK